jgi:putative hydrolase of the HAD superfamily
MAEKFSVVLFDLGSTLIYFNGSMPEVVMRGNERLAEALVNQGYRLDKDFVLTFRTDLRDYFHQRDVDFLEYTVEQVLRQTLQKFGYKDVPSKHLKAALREMYALTQSHWNLEDDALAVLDELKKHGYRLGLISNAADADDARALIERFQLGSWFELMLISAEVGYRKPHPQIFELALDFFKAQPDRVLMVGDKLGADILGAKNAGLTSVWITRRAHRDDNLAHEDTIRPDAVIQALGELPKLLEKWV